MNIFGKEADFDQLAIGTISSAKGIMEAIPGEWSQDHVHSIAKLLNGLKHEIQFRLFYNYSQDIPFKELELIQFVQPHNFHSLVSKIISPLGLYAPSLYSILRPKMELDFFISHLGIHCSSEEGEVWREHFKGRGICVLHEDWSYKHTNPVIAGKRNYHNIIFNSREELGFDFKACIRVPVY